MTSHFGLLLLFAFFVSLIFATITKDTPKEQFKLGLSLFGSFVGAAIVLGWLMRALPFSILLWTPVAVYMAAIFYGASMSQVPGPVGSWFSDTFLHAGGYFGLALLTLRALARGRWVGVTLAALVGAFVISLLHGAAVEWMQMYVPTRMAEWRDLGNDAVGAAIALGGAHAWGIMKAASRTESR